MTQSYSDLEKENAALKKEIKRLQDLQWRRSVEFEDLKKRAGECATDLEKIMKALS